MEEVSSRSVSVRQAAEDVLPKRSESVTPSEAFALITSIEEQCNAVKQVSGCIPSPTLPPLHIYGSECVCVRTNVPNFTYLQELATYLSGMKVFSIAPPNLQNTIDVTEWEIQELRGVWGVYAEWMDQWNVWKTYQFSKLDVDAMEENASK